MAMQIKAIIKRLQEEDKTTEVQCVIITKKDKQVLVMSVDNMKRNDFENILEAFTRK